MFGRIQNATNNGQASGPSGSSRGGGGAGAGAGDRNIAGAALRKAGLMDADVGMRSAAAGPSRRGASSRGVGGSRGPGAAGTNGGPSAIQIDDDGNSRPRGAARKARDRANPLAGRPTRRNAASTADPSVKGQVFSIRGAAGNANKKRAGGRVPGGGGDDSSSAPSTKGTVALLKRFLAGRWNGEAKFLNLENLKQDAVLTESKVAAPGQPDAHKDIGTVIFKLASEMYPEILTISLGHNDFKTLGPIVSLPQYIPHLRNLSLEGNDIKWTKDLAGYTSGKHGKFKNLQELILIGNPMQTNAASAMNEEGYRAEVIAKFPSLTLLDRIPVPPKGSAATSSGVPKPDQILGPETPTRNFPLQVRSGFSDEAATGIVPGFLHKYFTLFDTARDSPTMKAVYAANATWSLVVNRHVPPRAKSAGYHTSPDMPRQRDLNWNGYKQVPDHNIMGLGTRSASKGFPVGARAIVGTLSKLPKTTHPLSDPSKFVVDAWLLPNAVIGASAGVMREGGGGQVYEKPEAVLFISVKGEFAEAPSQGVRSFDRTFTVVPSTPGSPAAQAEWPCTILSEQLTIRHYSGINAFKPDSLPVGDGAPGAGGAGQVPPPQAPQAQPGVGPPPPAPGLNPTQHDLALKFSAETGLTYPFAVQCLSENGWDPAAAMNVFIPLRAAGSIPPEAFNGGVVPA